jgi:hypothetical protein
VRGAVRRPGQRSASVAGVRFGCFPAGGAGCTVRFDPLRDLGDVHTLRRSIPLRVPWKPSIMASLRLLMPIDPYDRKDRCRLRALSQNGSLMNGRVGWRSIGRHAWLPARQLGELDATLRAIVQDRCDALVVFSDAVM